MERVLFKPYNYHLQKPDHQNDSIVQQNNKSINPFGKDGMSFLDILDELIDFINRYHREGYSIQEAALKSGQARFRPIFLTSITTFVSLIPLLLEKSLQAQFLIPMAISLGFGVLFSTFITLILVPNGVIIIDQIKEKITLSN